MKPTLFALTFAGRAFALPSYGLAVTLGIGVGVWLCARQARRQGMNVGAVLDLLFWMLVAALVGSRVVFVALNAGHFAQICAQGGAARSLGQVLSDCAAPLRVWDGGLVFYGGAITGIAVGALYARRRRLPFAPLGDLIAPALAIGHALGRLGCFLAGCCYGKACGPDAAACVRFPAGSVAHAHLAGTSALPAGAPLTAPLHPTQLYEAVGELAIFAFLLLWRRRQRFAGELLLVYAVAYACLRGVIELFRGDAARRFVFELAAPALARALGLPPAEPLLLSTSQAVSLVVGAGALAAIVRQYRLARR
jgi:phosphatidylglycerol---prolipoprotein diacylglyceryl transferase